MAIIQEQDYQYTGNIEYAGGLKLSSGSPASGKVLTSDGSGNATWQSGGSGVVLSTTRTLTSAEILQIHTTPIELVAAQGPNTFISVLYVIYWMQFNTTLYATDTILRVGYYPSYTLIVTSDILQYSSNCLQRANTFSVGYGGGIIPVINTPVVAFTYVSNPTDGDSDVKVTVVYSVINL